MNSHRNEYKQSPRKNDYFPDRQANEYMRTPEVKKQYGEGLQTESPINVYKKDLVLEQVEMNYRGGK